MQRSTLNCDKSFFIILFVAATVVSVFHIKTFLPPPIYLEHKNPSVPKEEIIEPIFSPLEAQAVVLYDLRPS